MAKALGYGRVSHRLQKDTDSLPHQEQRCLDYWNFKLKPLGIPWGGFVKDSMVSARKKAFDRRPGGKFVLDTLEPGDHIIFDKIDRIWRQNRDFVFLMQLFEYQKITVHFCDLRGASVQMGTPMGDFMIRLMVSIAELESDMTSARIKDTFERRRMQGRYPGCRVPMGMQLVGTKKRHTDTRRLVYHDEQRAVMAEIVRLRDQEGLGWQQIYARLDERIRQLLGIDEKHPRDRLGFSSPKLVQKGYTREKQYVALGNPNPNYIHLTRLFGHVDALPAEKCSQSL